MTTPEYQLFETLLKASIKEPAPKVDAVAGVLMRLSELPKPIRTTSPTIDRTLLGFCGLSLTLAIVMVVLTIDQMWLLDDPLTSLFQPMGMAMR